MGYQLYRMIRDGATAAWNGRMVHLAQTIADDAHDPDGTPQDGWPWSALPIQGHWDSRGRWRDGLTERTGMSVRSISRTFAELAAAGYEMREQIGAGRNGRVVYTAPGHAMRFRVPPLPPRPAPERSPYTATVEAGAPAKDGDRPEGNARQIRHERSPNLASTLAKFGDPFSSGPLTIPSHTSQPLTEPDVEGSGNREIKTFDSSTRRGTDAVRRDQADALTAWEADHPEAAP